MQICPTKIVVSAISVPPMYVNRATSAAKKKNIRSDNTLNLGLPTCTVLKKGMAIKAAKANKIVTTPAALLGMLRRIA